MGKYKVSLSWKETCNGSINIESESEEEAKKIFMEELNREEKEEIVYQLLKEGETHFEDVTEGSVILDRIEESTEEDPFIYNKNRKEGK